MFQLCLSPRPCQVLFVPWSALPVESGLALLCTFAEVALLVILAHALCTHVFLFLCFRCPCVWLMLCDGLLALSLSFCMFGLFIGSLPSISLLLDIMVLFKLLAQG